MWESKSTVTKLQIRFIFRYLNLWNRLRDNWGVDEIIQTELFLVHTQIQIFFLFLLFFSMFPPFFYFSQYFLNHGLRFSTVLAPFSSISIITALLRPDLFHLPSLRSMYSIQTMSRSIYNILFEHRVQLRYNRFHINKQHEETFRCVSSMMCDFHKDSPVISSTAGGLGTFDGKGESWI